MSYLINASHPLATANQLQDARADYIELAEASYRVPLTWFMFFTETDFRECDLESVSFEGNSRTSVCLLPCTTVNKAIENIKCARGYFADLFPDADIALGYFDKTIEGFTDLEYEYLVLDASEYLMSNHDESQWHILKNASLRNEEAVKYLMAISGYTPSAKPYSVDEFYANASLEDPERVENSVALDPGFADVEYRLRYSGKAQQSEHSDNIEAAEQAQTEVTEKTQAVKKWWEFWK